MSGAAETVRTAVADRGVTAWHGFAVSCARPVTALPDTATVSVIAAGWRIEMSGAPSLDFETLARTLFGISDATPDAYMLVQEDATNGVCRGLAFAGDRMIGALLVDRQPLAIDRAWLVARLGTELGPSERFRVLASRPSGSLRSYGAKVCVCCDVGMNEIVDAVAAGCRSIHNVGIATRAGTNCRRCQPEIARVIELAAG